MKTKACLTLILAFILFSSSGAQNKLKDNNKINAENPHEEVKVNKKYDEKGNLIAFDSVYTYYYSNIEDDTLQMDSLLSDFNFYFDNMYGNNNSWDNLFEPDSVFHSNFFSNDFFEDQFLQQNQQMLKIMQEMDSIKNIFFQMHMQCLTP